MLFYLQISSSSYSRYTSTAAVTFAEGHLVRYGSSSGAQKTQDTQTGVSAEDHRDRIPPRPSDNIVIGSVGSVGEHFVSNSLYGTISVPQDNGIASYSSVGEHMVNNSLYSIPSAAQENIDSPSGISTSTVRGDGMKIGGASGDLSNHTYELVSD